MKQSGFTLIELSIVLVIISLIAGGVVAGRELIHQAALRATIKEFQVFDTAVNTYREKFRSLPGDDPRAYQWFGDSCGTDTTDRDTGCNGNGNGIISDQDDGGALPATVAEEPKFFEHLSRAHMMKQAMDGSCPNGTYTCQYVENTNFPTASYNGALWGVSAFPCYEFIIGCPSQRKNVLILSSAVYYYESNASAQVGIVSALDMLNIDTKLDDGKPNTGSVRGVLNLEGIANPENVCASSSDDDAAYVANSDIRCTGYFALSGG